MPSYGTACNIATTIRALRFLYLAIISQDLDHNISSFGFLQNTSSLSHALFDANTVSSLSNQQHSCNI